MNKLLLSRWRDKITSKVMHKCLHFSYDSVKKIADYLLEQTAVRPKIGITCGSGLGGLAEQVENAEVFEYSKIPNFPVSTGEQLIQGLLYYNCRPFL